MLMLRIMSAPDVEQDTTLEDLPEGPELPYGNWGALGFVFGIELETGRDLLSLSNYRKSLHDVQQFRLLAASAIV